MHYTNLPESLRDAAQRYVEKGKKPGDFLTACFENDLVSAVGRADIDNYKLLHDITTWIYCECPRHAWGSPELVAAWIKSGGIAEAAA